MKNNFRLTTIIVVTIASLFLVADAKAVILTFENNVPMDIPDAATIVSELTVTDSRIITDLNV